MRLLRVTLASLSLVCLGIACLSLAGVALPGAVAAAQAAPAPRARPPVERSRGYVGEQYRPGDIVCTKTGCRPLPQGCHAVNEETWEGPTGYAIIVCP